MSGILLIAMENGRSVKTYGANSSRIYNMKKGYLWLCVILSLSGCAFAEIEFYPGFRRPDPEAKWNKVPEEPVGDNTYAKLARYLEEHRRGLTSASLVPEESFNFREQPRVESPPYLPLPSGARRHIDPDFTFRIPENPRLPEDSTPFISVPKNTRRNPDFYELDPDFTFRMPSRMQQDDEPVIRQTNYEEEENTNRAEATSDSDFSFHDQPNFEAEERTEEFSKEHSDKQARENEEFSTPQKTFSVSDEPGLFAYPPSDPRYYQDSVQDDTIKERDDEEELNDKPQYVEIKPRQDITETSARGVLSMEQLQREIDRSVQMMPMQHHLNPDDTAGVYIIAVVAGISAAATVGLIAFGIGWYNLQKHVKNAADVEYPAYGVTGPNKEVSPSGDRRLAQSAQMYHYQHQKQQIIAMESRAAAGDGRHGSLSEAESDEENEEGDYTVYECPGLAPTGEMEVKNPLFQDDPTPATKTEGSNNVK